MRSALASSATTISRLFDNARQAADDSGTSCDIVKVTDIMEMLTFNAIGLPALAIDGQVKVAGRVATPDEIKSWLATASGELP